MLFVDYANIGTGNILFYLNRWILLLDAISKEAINCEIENLILQMADRIAYFIQKKCYNYQKIESKVTIIKVKCRGISTVSSAIYGCGYYVLGGRPIIL